MELKRYIAIGHWEASDNITSVTDLTYTVKDARKDFKGNGFVPYVVLTEKKFRSFHNVDDFETYEMVKHLTSNYRKWDDITDYISQCYDIMEQKMACEV